MSESTQPEGSLRYIFYGAGAIGGVVGGHLALAGKEVVMIGRPGHHMDAIRENGLRLITPRGTNTVPLMAVTAPDQIDFGSNDVVFMAVKSQDTEEALRSLHAVVKDVPLFCWQNGVHNEEAAAKYFPRVYGVRVRAGGVYTNDGEVTGRTDPPGSPIMGCYPTGTDSLVEAVAEDLREAGFRILVTPDIMPYKWSQLMGNLANAVSAITSSPEEESRPIIEAVRQEATEILSQAGIRWVSEADMARQWPEGRVVMPSSRYQNSTWQSLTRRQGTVETDFFNGEIVRLAGRLGKQAPINEAILRIVKEMAARRELPGKYTVPQLLELLGLTSKH